MTRRLAALLLCAFAVVTRSGPALADAAVQAKIEKGPYLTQLSESSVEVRVELDRPSPVSVELRRQDAMDAGKRVVFEEHVSGQRPSVMHVVHVANLAPSAAYAYAVRIDGRQAAQGQFTTLSPTDSVAPLRFLVYGDDRTDASAHAAVARALAATTSDFLVNTGDMVGEGGVLEDWQTFFDIESGLLRDHALFAAAGNHEVYADPSCSNFLRYFGFQDTSGSVQPRGTVRAGRVRFFFLNTTHNWRTSDDRSWLERELNRADSEPGLLWRIVVMHHGLWSSGPHGGSAMLIENRVPELLYAHKIDLILSGHDHFYERGDHDGLKYIVTGGGGAPLYRPASKMACTRKEESTYHFVEITASSDAIQLIARRLNGAAFDACGFTKGGEWDCDRHVNPAENVSVHTDPAPPGAPSARCGCMTAGARTAGGGVSLALVAAVGFFHRRRRHD